MSPTSASGLNNPDPPLCRDLEGEYGQGSFKMHHVEKPDMDTVLIVLVLVICAGVLLLMAFRSVVLSE
jgi:hypothetical protein